MSTDISEWILLMNASICFPRRPMVCSWPLSISQATFTRLQSTIKTVKQNVTSVKLAMKTPDWLQVTSFCYLYHKLCTDDPSVLIFLLVSWSKEISITPRLLYIFLRIDWRLSTILKTRNTSVWSNVFDM